MIVANTNQELQLARQALPGSVGLVMTMGALHTGHLSLVRLAKQHAQHVVVSIFVNPTQFAVGEDFDKYPRTLSADLALLEAENVDLVYAPTGADVYPTASQVEIDPGLAARVLEGRTRPTHFAGVCQVVLKFMNRIRPDVAVFGQKDAQQLALLQQMVADLDVPVELVSGEIIRDADGLAQSSRNRYLSVAQRQVALNLYRALQAGKRAGTNPEEILQAATTHLLNVPEICLDYVALATVNGFTVVGEYVTKPKPNLELHLDRLAGRALDCYLLVAAKVGETRLIDNLIIRGVEKSAS